ncbi:MAG: hypothetical protein JJU00_20145 [Opitutales bacterium]|nr:hypothetical protein [Opitutales bacterium]
MKLLNTTTRASSSAAFAVFLLLAAGCQTGRPIEGPVAEAPVVERIAFTRVADSARVGDRTAVDPNAASAQALRAIRTGGNANLRIAAETMRPFLLDPARFHAEDRARFGVRAILVGLASGDDECVATGVANLEGALPDLNRITYAQEAEVLAAGRLRLGEPVRRDRRTEVFHRILSADGRDGGFQPTRGIRIITGTGLSADVAAERERAAQAESFGLLGAWLRGDRERMGRHFDDLGTMSAMGAIQGYRVNLPLANSAEETPFRLYLKIIESVYELNGEAWL